MAELPKGPRTRPLLQWGDSLWAPAVFLGSWGDWQLMRTEPRNTVQLGELVATAFDIAAEHTADPVEVSYLATEAVVGLLRQAQESSREGGEQPPPNAVAIAKLSRMVELHHRLATAILAAVERSEPGGQEHLRKLRREQTSMALAVGELVAELGGSPPRSEESSSELPRDPRALSDAQDQAELMAFVYEDLDHVAAAHLELASFSEIPVAMRQRLEVLSRSGGVA